MRHWGLCILMASGWSGAQAAPADTIVYDHRLDTIQVVARRIRHVNEANAGARVTTIDPELLLANRTRSLSELLADNSAVYIKSLGTGALATASFRGGSAAQTRVNWNGINITPPMSGTFDFSQIPVFFTDNVDLYYGSSHVTSSPTRTGGKASADVPSPSTAPTAPGPRADSSTTAADAPRSRPAPTTSVRRTTTSTSTASSPTPPSASVAPMPTTPSGASCRRRTSASAPMPG